MAGWLRTLLISLFSLFGSALFVSGTAAQTANACSGENLIDRLRDEDRSRYDALRRAADAIPNGEGLLWRITTETGAVSYLVGTMHVGPKLVPDLPAGLSEVFDEVDAAAFELKEVADPAQMLAASFRNFSQLLLPDGESLRDFLTSGELLTLERMLARRGQALDFMHRFQPVYVATTLSFPSCGQQAGGSDIRKTLEATIDGRIADRITGAGKTVYGLETAEEQFASLTHLSIEHQVQLLRVVLDQAGELGDIAITMRDLYQSEEIGLFWEWNLMMSEALDARDISEAFTRALLDGRNRLMAERARGYLDQGKVLIAVGALHLPGEEGLVSLFRKQGLTVERVMPGR